MDFPLERVADKCLTNTIVYYVMSPLSSIQYNYQIDYAQSVQPQTVINLLCA